MLLRLADCVTASFVLACCVSLPSQTPVATLPTDPAATIVKFAHEKNGPLLHLTFFHGISTAPTAHMTWKGNRRP